MPSQTQHYYQTPGHIIAAGIILALLDIVVVTLRFIGRLRTKQELQIDDWLLLPATVLTTGVGALLVVGVTQEAFGYRTIPTSRENPSDEALQQMTLAIRFEWTISIILPIALACNKASFLFFYRRLFSISRRVSWLLWSLVGFVVAWAIAFVIATLMCCNVMTTAIWQPVAEMAQCVFFLQILMAFCITGFVTDLVIIAVPIPLVWRLRLDTPRKLMACASFLLGTVTVACALARLVVSVDFVNTAADPDNDNILNISLYVYWAMVEASMGVFAACLPTLQLFFRRWSGWEILSSKTRSLFSSRSSSTNNDNDPKDPQVHYQFYAGRKENNVGFPVRVPQWDTDQ
ncbi:hypothetical protein B0I35DRAFT_443691 [Stachybotrys elegans]|uniref:Rhodopsin domain-containing protein n=1 Tax=Stachybotrys elegans TaxID=80388 RepID=A0A8K0WMG0_9HYPO|nr:hypothetical protein B0I35DRAFT_443691 [Stachybotrys elegans]